MATRDFTEKVKIGLSMAAFFALFVGAIFAKLKKTAQQNEAINKFLDETLIINSWNLRLNALQTFRLALALIAFFGTVNYFAYGEKVQFEQYDSYDLLHYYINPKYYDELGSFRLLPALILADREAGEHCPGQVRHYLAQDENDYHRELISHAYAREQEVKSHFTPERWQQFVYDVSYLNRRNLNCALWRELLGDHGFNGTPSMVLLAQPIVNLIPVEAIKLATLVDAAWLIAMLAALAWAFGTDVFLFAWLFITLCYSFRWPIILTSMCRYDWIAAMGIGLCMMKKEKPVLSGAFFGYAALMRYFPALWLFGIFAKGVYAVFTRRDIPLNRIWQRVPNRYYQMALGFFLIVVVVASLAGFRYGFASHKANLEDMAAHVQPHNLSSRRTGLVIALVYRGETEQQLITNEKKQMVAAIEPTVRVVSIAALILLGLFFSRLKDFEAVGLCFMPYFWLTTSSYYFYVIRLTGVIVHASDLTKPRNVVGLFLLFFIELFSNASESIMPGNRYFHISMLCVFLAIYSVTMLAFLGAEWWKERKSGS